MSKTPYSDIMWAEGKVRYYRLKGNLFKLIYWNFKLKRLEKELRRKR